MRSKYFFKTYRSSRRRCSVKNVFLETSQNSQENTCLFFNKVAVEPQQTFLVFQDVFSVTLFVFQDVIKTYLQDVFLKRLQDVFKTFCKTCLQDVLQLYLQDVLEDKKCYTEDVFKTSSVRLHQDECLLGHLWSLLLNVTILFNQMQAKIKKVSLKVH